MTSIKEVVINIDFSELMVLKSYGIQKEYCKIKFVSKPLAMNFNTGITVNIDVSNPVVEIKFGKLFVNEWIYSLESVDLKNTNEICKNNNTYGTAVKNTNEITCHYFERSFIKSHSILDFKVAQANADFCILVNGYFVLYANANHYECWETCFNLLSVIKTNKFYFLTRTEVLYVLKNQKMKFIDKNVVGIMKKKSRCMGIKFADTGSLVYIYKYKNLKSAKWYFDNKIYAGFSLGLFTSLKERYQDKLLLIYWMLSQEMPREIVFLLMKNIIVKYKLTE